jgi:hypothetical protein
MTEMEHIGVCEICGERAVLERRSWYVDGEFVVEWWCSGCVEDDGQLFICSSCGGDD